MADIGQVMTRIGERADEMATDAMGKMSVMEIVEFAVRETMADHTIRAKILREECERLGVVMIAMEGAQGWQDIARAPKQKKIIVAYKNSSGKWRRTLALYFPMETLESEHNESGWADDGWYESSEEHEELLPLEYEPELWADLPPLPPTGGEHGRD